MRRAIVVAALILFATVTGRAYWATGQKWRAGSTITMQLQLGSSSTALIDGSADWNAVADNALADWNQYLGSVQFRSTRGSSAVSAGNGTNTVSFGDTVYGEPFGNGVLAITETLYRTSDQSISEADTIFNTKFSWNWYRGNLRNASGGGTLMDLRRVALHEFGHVLGLDHPDDYGQSVVAVMNSHVSNVDDLTADDIAGARSLYGGGTTTAAPAPAPVVPHDTLSAASRLLPGQAITSGNARYRLLYQTDGNLVLYDDTAHTFVWSSGTAGTTAGFAVMQADGNFVVYNAAGIPQWWTSTAGDTNAHLVVQNDGNLVVYQTSGAPGWDRFSAAQ